MNLLAQNCRGLGLDAAVGELRDLIRSYNPTVVFLCKTKKSARAMEKLKWSMGFKHGVAVDCAGRSGGLALWWRDGVEVSVRPWCQYYIDAQITFEDKSWRFTGIYGEPRTEMRNKMWEFLRYPRAQDDLPWLCAGDFNEALSQSEQLGGNLRSETQITAFRDCLLDCGLTDMGFHGYAYTWDNRREGSENIQVRLDRGTATASFLHMFPHSSMEHVVTEESDHMALVIKVADASHTDKLVGDRGFMFEEMWTKHEDYERMITEAWELGRSPVSDINGLWRRLQEMSKNMKKWSFETFGSVKAELKKLRAKLDGAQAEALVSGWLN
jgi:hypothetical protein